MHRFIFAALVLSTLGGAAHAQDAASGRYSMTPVEGGFLRLDTRTGEVSMCRPAGDNVQCRAAPDDRSALQSEIDRLAKENAELKSRLAAAPPAGAAPSRTQQEMDRALDYAERFMRRMMRIMRDDPPTPDRT
jgi:hypothetical protein